MSSFSSKPNLWSRLLLLIPLLSVLAGFQVPAQSDPAHPSWRHPGPLRSPRPQLRGWTIYAFYDTTEPNDFQGGSVPVTGMEALGAYFDTGSQQTPPTSAPSSNGDTKDPETDLRSATLDDQQGTDDSSAHLGCVCQ